MNRFGYNERNDADKTISKIVDNQIGSKGISKSLFAGDDKTPRLLDAIYEATADHPNHQSNRCDKGWLLSQSNP